MMQEQLIKFQTAKLAQEKGFNEGEKDRGYSPEGLFGSRYGVDGESIWWENGTSQYDFDYEYKFIQSPSQTVLQKWFRDKHNKIVIVSFSDEKKYSYEIYRMVFERYELFEKVENYDFFEEALENGLVEAFGLI